jgi:hypothetical protein
MNRQPLAGNFTLSSGKLNLHTRKPKLVSLDRADHEYPDLTALQG